MNTSIKGRQRVCRGEILAFYSWCLLHCCLECQSKKCQRTNQLFMRIHCTPPPHWGNKQAESFFHQGEGKVKKSTEKIKTMHLALQSPQLSEHTHMNVLIHVPLTGTCKTPALQQQPNNRVIFTARGAYTKVKLLSRLIQIHRSS